MSAPHRKHAAIIVTAPPENFVTDFDVLTVTAPRWVDALIDGKTRRIQVEDTIPLTTSLHDALTLLCNAAVEDSATGGPLTRRYGAQPLADAALIVRTAMGEPA